MDKSTGTQQAKAIVSRLSRTQTKFAIAASIVAILGLVGSGVLWSFTTLVEAADDRYLLKTGSLTKSIATVQTNQKNFKINSLKRDVRYLNDKIWDLEGYMEKSPNAVTARERFRLKELKEDRDILKTELDRVKRQ